MNPARFAPLAAVAVAALLLASCAATARAPGGTRAAGSLAPQPDSITVGLWHLDETGGTRAADAGPFRLDGTVGVDTRSEFGRIRNGRVFTSSVESFVLVPYSPALEQGSGLSVEAWVSVSELGVSGDAHIAARWTPLADQQTWVFAVVGREKPSPWRLGAPGTAAAGALAFAFQTQDAGPVRVFFSTARLEPARWTHVAVTYDGARVRFWIDGRPDAQFAASGTLRHTSAPLVLGNLIDPRGMSDFGGDLRAAGTLNTSTAAAFVGGIDEVRLSSAARRDIAAGY